MVEGSIPLHLMKPFSTIIYCDAFDYKISWWGWIPSTVVRIPHFWCFSFLYF